MQHCLQSQKKYYVSTTRIIIYKNMYMYVYR